MSHTFFNVKHRRNFSGTMFFFLILIGQKNSSTLKIKLFFKSSYQRRCRRFFPLIFWLRNSWLNLCNSITGSLKMNFLLHIVLAVFFLSSACQAEDDDFDKGNSTCKCVIGISTDFERLISSVYKDVYPPPSSFWAFRRTLCFTQMKQCIKAKIWGVTRPLLS